MDIYLAGRLDTGEGALSDFSEELESRDHRIVEKWFLEGRLPKPYLDHTEITAPAAQAMIKAAFESDVFVLFPTDDILGAATELGAAIASSLIKKQKQVLVVNPWEVRQSVFYAHPAVIAVQGLDQIRQMEWY
jgi:hypothetical protein